MIEKFTISSFATVNTFWRLSKNMADIRLEIQAGSFLSLIKLLLAVAENFPHSWPYLKNKYWALAEAIIDLHMPSLQKGLANSHSLTRKLEVALWNSGDLEMLEKLARHRLKALRPRKMKWRKLCLQPRLTSPSKNKIFINSYQKLK